MDHGRERRHLSLHALDVRDLHLQFVSEGIRQLDNGGIRMPADRVARRPKPILWIR